MTTYLAIATVLSVPYLRSSVAGAAVARFAAVDRDVFEFHDEKATVVLVCVAEY